MNSRLPLPTLLSNTLVAFTIEFDNEFEHHLPHRTTSHGSTADSPSAPWLVSMTMWLMLMRFVPVDGISVGQLQFLSGLGDKEIRTWLTRLGKWWGYVVVTPDTSDTSSRRSAASWKVRPTTGGRKAVEIWRPLTITIEKRWQERFGKSLVDQLEKSLRTLAGQLDADLPDYLPILGYDLFSKGPDRERLARIATHRTPPSEYTLPILLSKALLAFALQFERDSGISLAISANVLRLIGRKGARVRDLPLLSGVSKEAIAMSIGRLEKRGFATVQPESPGSRVKILVLTPDGRHAQDAYHKLVSAIEERWKASFGEDTIRNLRESLEPLVGSPSAQLSPLLRGLESHPSGWRAATPKSETLPHYPMVLHRGGFPDGS